MSILSRKSDSFLAKWWWSIDTFMLGAILVLMVIGAFMVATAGVSVAAHLSLDQYHFFKRHLFFLGLSLAVLLITSCFSTKGAWRAASAIYVLSLMGLILTLTTGAEIKGAQRWIHVFGFSVQPSEFLKPAVIILAAWLMQYQKENDRFPGNILMVVIYGLPVTLLLMQPDLGMTVLILSVWAAQIFLMGFPIRYFVGFGVVAVAGLVMAYFSFSHVQSRIDRYLNPESGDTYQISKSMEAFQNGGLFGTGLGQGSVKFQLPDSHADFIFAVAAEEMGLIFVIILTGLFLFIILRGFKRVMQSEDIFVILAAGGLLTMIGLQTFIHIGSTMNLIPTKGMTLPLISYGGSSILSTAFAFGVIIGITRRKQKGSALRTRVA